MPEEELPEPEDIPEALKKHRAYQEEIMSKEQKLLKMI